MTAKTGNGPHKRTGSAGIKNAGGKELLARTQECHPLHINISGYIPI